MPAIPGDSPMQAMMRYAQMGQEAPQPEPSDDWLTEALNAVHRGMVEEGDAEQVSLLGAILNQLTTFQAKRMKPQPQAAQGG